MLLQRLPQLILAFCLKQCTQAHMHARTHACSRAHAATRQKCTSKSKAAAFTNSDPSICHIVSSLSPLQKSFCISVSSGHNKTISCKERRKKKRKRLNGKRMIVAFNPGWTTWKIHIFEWWWHKTVIPITQITDAKFIGSSSSNLDLLMTVGRKAGGEVQPPEGPGNK